MIGPRLVALALGALLLHASPLASATAGDFRVESGEPVHVAGATTMTLASGALEAWAPEGAPPALLENVTGVLLVQTWSSLRVQTPGALPQVVLEPAMGPPQEERIPLREARIEYRLDGAAGALRANFSRGAAIVRQVVEESGRPLRLHQAVEQSDATIPGAGPEDVRWRWEAGWMFVGDMDLRGDHLEGFPTLAQPAIALRGPAELRLDGGTLLVTQEGSTRTFALSATADAGPRERARAIVRADFEDTRLPSFPRWAIASEQSRLQVEGIVEWRNATGVIAGRAVRDATVRAEGITETSAAPAAARPLAGGAEIYTGSGAWSSVAVDGAALRAPTSPAVAAAPAIGIGAALLFALYLYTRISRDALLHAPIRQKIYHEVALAPGIHMRELFRRVGGGWGGFRAHLRALEAAGYVKTAKAGNQRTVYLQTEAAPEAALHPTARKILEHVPSAGQSVAVADLARSAGVSRQLVRYHLERLAELGLVGAAGEARRVVRESPDPRS